MTVQLRHTGGPWQQAARLSFPHETELQTMLYQSPQLIPLRAGENAARVFVRESGLPGSGSTDLLGVDSDGNIYIVECKLANNSEIRRKVIGQVLEYAAFLWNIAYEEFDQYFVRRKGGALVELMRKQAGEDWEPEIFREQVAKNLKTGTFHLIVAVDMMNDELAQVIRYLAASAPSVRLEAVEINVYKHGEIEVLVPEIHGRELTRESSSSLMKTLDQVLESCPTETARKRLVALIDRWKGFGHGIEPRTKGISFRAEIEDEFRPVFWAPNPDFVCVNFNDLLSEGVPQDAVASYKEKIAAIKGFDRKKVMTQAQPRARFEEMDDRAVERVADVNHELVTIWRSHKRAPSESG